MDRLYLALEVCCHIQHTHYDHFVDEITDVNMNQEAHLVGLSVSFNTVALHIYL